MSARRGFFGGVGALFEGVGFVVGTPSLWGYAAVPFVVATGMAAAFGWAGLVGAEHAATALAGTDAEGLAAALAFILRAAFSIAAILIALLLAVTLAQPLSGWAIDRIVRAQEAALGVAPRAKSPAFASALRSLGVALTALAVGVPLVLLLTLAGVLFPPATVVTIPLKLAVSALCVAWDLLDYPLGLRGLGVGARLSWFRANLGAAFGFGLAAAVALFVPCAGLAVLSVGAAGAARLAVDAERAG